MSEYDLPVCAFASLRSCWIKSLQVLFFSVSVILALNAFRSSAPTGVFCGTNPAQYVVHVEAPHHLARSKARLSFRCYVLHLPLQVLQGRCVGSSSDKSFRRARFASPFQIHHLGCRACHRYLARKL